MREIVPGQIWETAARLRGEDAVFDLALYNKIFKTHYLQAFKVFRELNSLSEPNVAGATTAPDEQFDSDAYLREGIARREALNRFIRQKPYLVVSEERFFVITFLSEIELRIDELTALEVADIVNRFYETRGLVATAKSWLRSFL